MDKLDLPPAMGSVAVRALRGIGVNDLSQVTGYTEKELLAIHGIGPKAVRIIKQELSRKMLKLKV